MPYKDPEQRRQANHRKWLKTKAARIAQGGREGRSATYRLPEALQGLSRWFGNRRRIFEAQLQHQVEQVLDARDTGSMLRIAGLANDEGTDFEYRR